MQNRQMDYFVGGGGGVIGCHDIFKKIISPENLFAAWYKFKKGKLKKQDVRQFWRNLEDNLFNLRNELASGRYRHGPYRSFYVHDPKRRHIHKASVRDRVLHHAIVRVIEPIFEPRFIFDSYSCRKNKGVQKAVGRFREFGWRLSRNNTKTVWALKCDIKKFFDSVDHRTLVNLIAKQVNNEKAIELAWEIIDSFHKTSGKGLPLGNLTSQLFANVYLNELDQFIKRILRIKYYVRYCDDFVILSCDKGYLENLLAKVSGFLNDRLNLELHPEKVFLQRYSSGIDFLGCVCFPHYRILRAKTKRRMLKRLAKDFKKESFISYLGLVSHCRSRGVKMEMIKRIVYNHRYGGAVSENIGNGGGRRAV